MRTDAFFDGSSATQYMWGGRVCPHQIWAVCVVFPPQGESLRVLGLIWLAPHSKRAPRHRVPQSHYETCVHVWGFSWCLLWKRHQGTEPGRQFLVRGKVDKALGNPYGCPVEQGSSQVLHLKWHAALVCLSPSPIDLPKSAIQIGDIFLRPHIGTHQYKVHFANSRQSERSVVLALLNFGDYISSQFLPRKSIFHIWFHHDQ